MAAARYEARRNERYGVIGMADHRSLWDTPAGSDSERFRRATYIMLYSSPFCVAWIHFGYATRQIFPSLVRYFRDMEIKHTKLHGGVVDA